MDTDGGSVAKQEQPSLRIMRMARMGRGEEILCLHVLRTAGTWFPGTAPPRCGESRLVDGKDGTAVFNYESREWREWGREDGCRSRMASLPEKSMVGLPRFSPFAKFVPFVVKAVRSLSPAYPCPPSRLSQRSGSVVVLDPIWTLFRLRGPLRLVFRVRKPPFQPENRKIRPQIDANGSRRSPASADRLPPTSPLHRRLARRFIFGQYFAASRRTMCIRSARFVSMSRNYRL